MFFAGGACFCALVRLANCPRLPLPLGAAAGALGITALELVVGQTCLVFLRVRVWDYSPEWGNIAGFVCPRYTVLWYFLCLWAFDAAAAGAGTAGDSARPGSRGLKDRSNG